VARGSVQFVSLRTHRGEELAGLADSLQRMHASVLESDS
jgi:hypothetical protein